MPSRGPKKRGPPEEPLNPPQDEKSLLVPNESSSDEEDLVPPENTTDSSDSDHEPPTSESDEDYSDEDYVPSSVKGPRPSRALLTKHGKAAPGHTRPLAPGHTRPLAPGHTRPLAPGHTRPLAPGHTRPLAPGHTRPLAPESAAPPPTGKRKRGRPSLGNAAPATKRGTSGLVFTKEEEEDDDDEEEEDDSDDEEDSDDDEEEDDDDVKQDEDEEWHHKEEESVTPPPLRFLPVRPPGPTCDSSTSWSPFSLFQLFFSDSVIQKILDNTNANAAKRKRAGMKFKWEVLTKKDFYTFLGIIIFTGLVTVHHRSDYWKKKWPYNFHFPGDHMSRQRFEAILWSLHLSDPEEDEENDRKRHTAEYDRLFKIKPLYTEMADACKANFQPHQNLSMDERMVKSKASMKPDVKNTPRKWSYKLLVLADASIGYTWNFSVDSGRRESSTGRLSSSAVMDLLPFPLLGDGYLLFTHSSCTSPALFTELSNKNMGCCGTLRRKVPGFPKTQTNALPKKAERGDMRWLRRGQLLFVKWMDTVEVSMCSTVHQAYSGQTVRRKVKAAREWKSKTIPVPDGILDYNRNMGGVYLSDALIRYYSVGQKTMKWYKTLFYHFVDIAVVNSYLLHKELRKDPVQAKPLTHKTFREQLVIEILEFAEGPLPDRPPPPPPHTTCMPMYFNNEEALIRKHCRRCQGAGRLRVKTAIYCTKCQVPLCFNTKKNCFKLWHEALTS